MLPVYSLLYSGRHPTCSAKNYIAHRSDWRSPHIPMWMPERRPKKFARGGLYLLISALARVRAPCGDPFTRNLGTHGDIGTGSNPSPVHVTIHRKWTQSLTSYVRWIVVAREYFRVRSEDLLPVLQKGDGQM